MIIIPQPCLLKAVIPVPNGPVAITALGQVAAGIPLEAIEDQQRNELLNLLTTPGRYALQVGDDSMSEAGILAGDFIVVQSQQRARDGDIVVALIDNEQVVLKRIRYRPDDRIQLLADNPDASDLILEHSRVVIQGKVVGQVRSYR